MVSAARVTNTQIGSAGVDCLHAIMRAHNERISNIMGWGPYTTLVSDKQK